MPKLVTNNRKQNLEKIEELFLERLKSEGITEALMGKMVKTFYGTAPWYSARSRKAQKSRRQMFYYMGHSLLLLCKKHSIPTKAGFVYAVTNKTFPNCVKLGHTKDCEDRLMQYQTHSPLKDYEMTWQQFTLDSYAAEQKLLSLFERIPPNGEWVSLQTEDTLKLKQLLNKSFKSLSY
ncbi:hypothetical protein IW18_97 [Vibrio phage IW18]|nr:hypothetical protein IW18_97 [Vibrio phage IW18]